MHSQCSTTLDLHFIILCSILAGIVILILSIVFRKNKRLRRIFVNVGLLIGVLPLLFYIAFSLVTFIKERQFVGNYEGDTGVQGVASLDIYDDNTFILRSDSCSTGFVQGEWEYNWSKSALDFSSTSQRMGDVTIDQNDSIVFTNIPVCIKLVRSMKLGRSGKPLVPPLEENSL